MSSVNSADRNSNDEALRRARETYQQNESENVKKQRQEIRNLTEAHQAEVNKLQQQHVETMNSMKDKTREAITRRDMEYQKEINDLREMHQKAIAKAVAEGEEKGTRAVEAIKTDYEKSKEISAAQKEQLTQHFAEEMRARDQQFEQSTSSQRETMKDSNNKTRDQLAQAHQKEVKALINDRDNRINNARRGYEALRQAKDEQLSNLDLQSRSTIERLRGDMDSALSSERETHELTQANQRAGFDHGLKKNQARYQKALEKNTNVTNDARRELAESASDRINNRMRSIEGGFNRLKADYQRAQIDNGVQKQRELQNVRDSYQAELDVSERTRRETLGAANEKTHEEINRLNEKNTDLVMNNTKFYQDKATMDLARNNERFLKQKTEADRALNQEKISSEGRVNKLKGFQEVQELEQRSFFDGASRAMRENFDKTLREMRGRNMEDQQKLFDTFAKQAQESDQKFKRQMDDIQIRYEKQIALLKDQQQKSIEEVQRDADRRLAEQQSQAAMQLKSQGSQYEYRIAKNEEVHKREIQDMNRKHEEALNSLLKIKKT